MSSLVVVGVLTTTSKEARQKVIDQFSKIVEYSKENESGVIKYAITVQRDTSDETTVYAIEEYEAFLFGYHRISELILESFSVHNKISR